MLGLLALGLVLLCIMYRFATVIGQCWAKAQQQGLSVAKQVPRTGLYVMWKAWWVLAQTIVEAEVDHTFAIADDSVRTRSASARGQHQHVHAVLKGLHISCSHG